MKDTTSEKLAEWSAITVLNVEKRTIGWSPKLKKSVFINGNTGTALISELKRIREVDIVFVYDPQMDRTRFIELKEGETEQFDDIYSRYLEMGGQMFHSQKKKGRVTCNIFMLEEGTGMDDASAAPERKTLF